MIYGDGHAGIKIAEVIATGDLRIYKKILY